MLENQKLEQENMIMTDQEKDQQQQKQPTEAEIYGQQGNQGQYGQGQYDSEGKPDSNGPQSQRIASDDQKQQLNKPNKVRQSPNYEEHSKNVPHD